MIFRQLYDNASSTYTYLLADENTQEAVIIDPVFEQHDRDTALLRELDVTLLYAMDTHCHADHVTGSWLLQQKVGCKIALADVVGAENVDIGLNNADQLSFGEHRLVVRSTPGHTSGCLTYVLDDKSMAFTGDALLIRGCGRCDFQQGDASALFHSLSEQILSLPPNCLLYPAHDYEGRTVSTVKEEIDYNPRIGGGANEADFVGYMNAMQLPHPKKIDIALPANMVSGKPADGTLPTEPDWAPVKTNYAGVPEITPEWVSTNSKNVCLLDVREPAEIAADAVKISNAISIPLGTLREQLAKVPNDKPVVTFCRAGKRSAMAVEILHKAGYAKVANIAGGLLRWQDEGYELQKEC